MIATSGFLVARKEEHRVTILQHHLSQYLHCSVVGTGKSFVVKYQTEALSEA